MTPCYIVLLYILSLYVSCGGWRAVPANQASFATRSESAGVRMGYRGRQKKKINIHELPRNTLHSIYKFGYCPPDVTKDTFLRTSVNVSFENFHDSNINYLYLVAQMQTQRFKLQCIVMKFYSPRMFLLTKSRLPLYYCQGQLLVMMFDTVHRLAVHEFYFSQPIGIPMNIYVFFYQPSFS